MRIGHYQPGIWHQGGISSYVQRVAQGQRAQGHDVFFFDRVPTPPLAKDRPDTAPIVIDSIDALFRKAAELQLDVLNVHGPLDDLPEDHVPTVRTLHGHEPYCPSGSQHLKRSGQPCKRVYSATGCLHGHFIGRCGSIRPQNLMRAFRQTQVEQRVLPQITTITVSRFLKERMVQAGYPEDRIHVLHSPAPAVEEPFQPPPDGLPRFAFVGRIVPQKGLDVLLRGMTQVPDDVQLDVVGDGYVAGEMHALVQELGLSPRVTFHGWCESKRVKTLMQNARALVFPSTWHEPAGLVTLEAAAMGRPVIASRAGGIPEYALDDFALLAPPGDEKALAGHVRQLANDRTRAERMGRAGREVAREMFAEEDFFQKLEVIYMKAIQKERALV